MIVAAGMINCALDSATKRISPYKRGRSKGKPVLLHAVGHKLALGLDLLEFGCGAISIGISLLESTDHERGD
jgi:hypothetical protein